MQFLWAPAFVLVLLPCGFEGFPLQDVGEHWDAGVTVYAARCAEESHDAYSCDVQKGSAGLQDAIGFFADDVETIGWGRLAIKTSSSAPGVPAFAAGFLEGYLTADRVIQHVDAAFSGFKLVPVPLGVRNYIEATDRWWGKMVDESDPSDEYWQAARFVRNQIRGLAAGVNSGLRGRSDRRVSYFDMLLTNMLWDVEDITPAVNKSARPSFEKSANDTLTMWARRHGHCSAVVKLLPDGSDIFAGHNTWMPYHLMLRIFKRYEFGSRTPISMPSQPGALLSGDDFYQIGNLVVLETTLPMYNNNLYDLIKPESLPFMARCMVANRLATSGAEWMELYKRYNSGTYNNAWMVVDYSRFEPGKPLKAGTLTVGEQVPGHFHWEDKTTTLSYGYWPSYNAAVFPETVRLVRQDVMEKARGNEFSYQMVQRAQIFRRDQAKVHSDEDMQRLMRYNRWQQDPVAGGDPCNQIACRSDLSPKPATRAAFGAVDAKYTSGAHVRKGRMVIISGPSHDDQPVFDWRTADESVQKTPHNGQPDRFDFGWYVIGTDLVAKPWSPQNAIPVMLFITVVSLTLTLLAVVGAAFRRHRSAVEEEDARLIGYKRLQGSPAESTVSTACPSSPETGIYDPVVSPSLQSRIICV